MARIRSFGEIDGVGVEEIVLTSDGGATASILTIGAAIRGLEVPIRGGRRQVALGFDSVEGYRDNGAHVGVMVGRCANRIAGGRFRLDGVEHRVLVNESGRNTLHGGPMGFTRRVWSVVEASADRVTLELESADGDQGFPGRVVVRLTYRLSGAGTLDISATATCDAPTPVNLANHAYLTLNEAGDCREHMLEIAADLYTPVDAALIPTGAMLPVAGTVFDFRTARRIGGDYDIAFALAGVPGERMVAARATAPDGRLALEVVTDQPSLQLYTAGFLSHSPFAAYGLAHGPHAGFCLEAQGFVDAPNHRNFPSVILRPGEAYGHETTYRLLAL